MALLEMSETLCYGLQQYTQNVTVAINDIGTDGAINIVLGAHLLSPLAVAALPAGTIIYNSEQMDPASTWVASATMEAIMSSGLVLWDYSECNIRFIQSRWPMVTVRYVPIGYVAQLSRIAPAPEQDIDVLFYGSMNERRQRIIDGLRLRGLQVKTLFGVYGADRDALIGRAKVVLNMHYYGAQIFEAVRVSYLLTNSKAVVSEIGPDEIIEPPFYRDAVAGCHFEDLVDRCIRLCGDADARRKLEAEGHRLFKENMPEGDCLAPVMSSFFQTPQEVVELNAEHLPLQINLGSGKNFRPAFLNIDVNDYWMPDLVVDLSKPGCLPATLDSQRFGLRTMKAGAFERIIANDVLEHVPDLVTLMTNCLALLKTGGDFLIQVPYELSYGAWQDPTHVRAFNERSWLYYTDWFWYLGWQDHRFDNEEVSYDLSPLGKKLQEEGLPLEMILLQPRAVDVMTVRLRKRALTVEEKMMVGRYLQRPSNRI